MKNILRFINDNMEILLILICLMIGWQVGNLVERAISVFESGVRSLSHRTLVIEHKDYSDRIYLDKK